MNMMSWFLVIATIVFGVQVMTSGRGRLASLVMALFGTYILFQQTADRLIAVILH